MNSSRARRQSLLIFEIQFPMLFYVSSRSTRNEKWSPKIKIDYPMFVDEQTIPMVHQDDDYDDYNTPNKRRIDAEISFMEPDTSEATSTLRLKQKVKRD